MGKPVTQNTDPSEQGGPEKGAKSPQISNAEIKNSKLFQDVTSKLADMQRKLDEATQWRTQKEEAEKRAQNEREVKELETQKDYESAAQKRIDAAVAKTREEEQTKAALAMKRKDAVMELTRIGFTNKAFLNGAVDGYDPSGDQSPEDWAKAFSELEENQVLLSALSGSGGQSKQPSLGVIPRASVKTLTPEQIREMRKSKDPVVKAEVDQYVLEFANKHGRSPFKNEGR